MIKKKYKKGSEAFLIKHILYSGDSRRIEELKKVLDKFNIPLEKYKWALKEENNG